ncbi:MAG TPA: AAA family ATPase, partial [Phycisphaerae bacterium]|nr:AAA family ATPase [Phycisphaerae bacterium]
MRCLELYPYNPDQQSDEDLEATFVARECVLASILDDLRAGVHSPSNQHFLITGPRGIGKTMLLIMIRRRVANDPKLAAAYLPIKTAEEEYSISNLRDFFARVIELLAETVEDEALPAALAALDQTDDDDQGVDLAVEALKSFSRRDGRKLLLLWDNLDLILDQQMTDNAQLGRLRDVLMNDSFLVLIGTAPSHFSEVSGYDRPFYNFFRPIDLKELTAAESADLLHKRAEVEENGTMLERFDELRPRLQAIHHLTGGNPRLALMLYQLYTRTELPEVQGSIKSLLDDVTPYYKHRLESLSPQQRKVMDTFARLGRPATPTELAAEVRLEVNQINSILKRLRDLGFVSVAPQQRRKSTLYLVSDRVFRIWHQMRFSTASRKRL